MGSAAPISPVASWLRSVHQVSLARPDTISALPSIAVASVDNPLEAEADRMAKQVVSSEPRIGTGSARAAGGTSGTPLDLAIRTALEPRFGNDLADVRVHTGSESAAAARSLNARAYTVGQDIFFGEGRYDPHSREGLRLLVHELSHTVQQSGGRSAQRLSSATRGVYRDPIPQSTDAGEDGKKSTPDQVTVPVPPALLTHLQLTPPSLLGPTTSPNSSSSSTTIPPPSQYSPSAFAPPSQPNPLLSPPGGSAGSATSAPAPKAPDRVSLVDLGSLSIGARFGFPDLSKDTTPDGRPSALQESLKKTEVLNYMITGAPPSEYSVDPGKLVGALWGIFSTQIAPGVARKIAAGLASKPAGGGVSYQLDATLLLKFGSGSGPTASKTGGGGGATLTIIF
jgi:hypothetical protein